MIESELAWKLADYEAANIEPPARCTSNPELTEGEMMSAEEVEDYIKDSLATLRILADKNSARLPAVLQTYRADLTYLVQVGSLGEDDYNDLTQESNLRF